MPVRGPVLTLVAQPPCAVGLADRQGDSRSGELLCSGGVPRAVLGARMKLAFGQ